MSEVTAIRTLALNPAEQEYLPHNIEAEQQLLGAILTNNDVYDRIAATIRAEHFFEPVHQRIFEIAVARIQKNALASPVTLKAFLEDDQGLRELGGPSYLARLAGAAISAFAARDYAQMIYDLAVRRELIGLGRDISERAAKVDVTSEPKEQIIEAEQRLYKLGEQGHAEKGFQSFLKAVTDAVNMANAAYQRDGGLAGISTGLVDLDKKLADPGWSPVDGKDGTCHQHCLQHRQSAQTWPSAGRVRRVGRWRSGRLLFAGNVRRATGGPDTVGSV